MATTSLLVIALPTDRLLAQSGRIRRGGEVIGPLEDASNAQVKMTPAETPGSTQYMQAAEASSGKREKGATTAKYLSDGFDKMGWGKYSGPDPDGWTAFPRDGKMAVLIDYKGNWEFSGGFPSQKMYYPCSTEVGVGLKSSIGQVIAFLGNGTVPAKGKSWSFSKQGHAQVVEDLWKDVVKGHHFHGSWSTQQITPKGGPRASAASDVENAIKAALGPIGFLF
jgi:hypothetical protein